MVSPRTIIILENLVILHEFLPIWNEPHWIEDIYDTPAEKLASQDPTDACFDKTWQTVGEREQISKINCNFFQIKTAGQTCFFSSLSTVLTLSLKSRS
ncbi:hypothetical protein SRABI133_00639 [Peribacillus simplex]|uniref:Uncharacterized protein n=2 Tax=Peribacillus simplex TaxID=1478 RepID=A0A9W4KQA5_9BACI|nr:hypothetical protein SRABI133_00639 [Peribacillus simplex]